MRKMINAPRIFLLLKGGEHRENDAPRILSETRDMDISFYQYKPVSSVRLFKPQNG